MSCHCRGRPLLHDPSSLPLWAWLAAADMSPSAWEETLSKEEFFKHRKKGSDADCPKNNYKRPVYLTITRLNICLCVYWPLRFPFQWITYALPPWGGSSFSYWSGWVLYKFWVITLKPIVCVKVRSSSLWLIFSLVYGVFHGKSVSCRHLELPIFFFIACILCTSLVWEYG